MRQILIHMKTASKSAQDQQLDFLNLKALEHQLDDVMELIDKEEVKLKLEETEKDYKESPSVINKVRLGIIYHETALNLSFFSKTDYKGYAQKSFDILTELFTSIETQSEYLPIIAHIELQH